MTTLKTEAIVTEVSPPVLAREHVNWLAEVSAALNPAQRSDAGP